MEFKKASVIDVIKWIVKILWFGINYWFDVLIDLM